MENEKNTNEVAHEASLNVQVKKKKTHIPKILKSKPFIFGLLTLFLALATFTMFLIDSENMYRPKVLDIPFFLDLMKMFGIERFNVSITTWALFLIIFGIFYIAFAAWCFYGLLKKGIYGHTLKKKGREITDAGKRWFHVFFIFLIVVCLAILGIFTWLWFPWYNVHWSSLNINNFWNFLECLGLIIGLMLIVPVALLLVLLVFKFLILLITVIAGAVSRGVMQTEGYQEALAASQLANAELQAAAAKKYGSGGGNGGGNVGGSGAASFSGGASHNMSNNDRPERDILFPALTVIDNNWKKKYEEEDANYEAALKEAEANGTEKPVKPDHDADYKLLETFSASAADRRSTGNRTVEPSKDKNALKLDPAKDPKNKLKNFAYEFQAFLANKHHYYFDISILRSFIAGLNAARLILLEGLSGTGKTTLPRMFLEYVGGKAYFFPVQATWRDRSDIVGYYSDFTGEFKETELLKRLYEASYIPANVNLMVLDEMNISRVEYYFADFLSIFEYPSQDWLVPLMNVKPGAKLPKYIEDGKVKIPSNTWFVGTVNIDDSTFTITDKVYDRAIVIDFRELTLPFTSKYNDEPHPLRVSELYEMFKYCETNDAYCLNDKARIKFLKLCDFTAEVFDIRFGNRIMNQIDNFLPPFVAMGGSKDEALDIMFARKVLRKLDGKFESYINDGLVKLQRYINTNYGKHVLKETELLIEKYKRKFS